MTLRARRSRQGWSAGLLCAQWRAPGSRQRQRERLHWRSAARRYRNGGRRLVEDEKLRENQ